ncbi:hypothetical protein CMI38_02600 [Candidatus Pacearchaeota archaeon]|nr:hypothetical protein [Candidatus Pacearchaeota archaeon]|tara:strand:+ start:102 stop:341 length:240 start_codon:yes stop_codon:yes gene_type:complete
MNTIDIHYDPEADLLEILFRDSPNDGHSEEVGPGVFIHRVEETNEIYGIGIISFKKRPQVLGKILKKININLPINITNL